MFSDDCKVLCGVLHKLTHMHKYMITNYTQYIFKMIFPTDSYLVLYECCWQFEGLATCVESPLTSSSQSNTYKIFQLFFRTFMYYELVSQATSNTYKILQLF